VIDLVHFQQQLLHHIVPDQLKVCLSNQVCHILLAACEEVVYTDDLQQRYRRDVPSVGLPPIILYAGDAAGATAGFSCSTDDESNINSRGQYFWIKSRPLDRVM